MLKAIKKLTALLAALLMLASVMPAFAVGAADYNEHDVQKLRAFFEQADENGVRNGDKLFAAYSPDDPATWVGQTEQEIAQFSDVVKWNGENRLFGLCCSNRGLSGKLDLSGCAALDHLWCWGNYITELNVDGCTDLRYVHAKNNRISELGFEGVEVLYEFDVSKNRLTEVDALQNVDVINMDVSYNELSELDLSRWEWLDGVNCSHNRLTSLRIPYDCRTLEVVRCNDNLLTDLVVEKYISELICSNNSFTELDLSYCEVGTIECTGSPLRELHFNTPGRAVDLYSGGNGSIGARTGTTGGFNMPEMQSVIISAYPDDGYILDAWYDRNGNWAYFYNECEIYGDDVTSIDLTAVFEPGEEPGPPSPGYEVWNGDLAEEFAGGRGTEAEPYLISNGAELWLLQMTVGRATCEGMYFELTNDVYLNEIEDYESWTAAVHPERHWRGIGNGGYFSSAFKGNFNGNGHTVYGIYSSYVSYAESYCGLFGYVIGAVIQNVNVDCSAVFPVSTSGLVVGRAVDSRIINCSSNGRVECYQGYDCGGVVGAAEKTLISNCKFYGTIEGFMANRVGGVAGSCSGIDSLMDGCCNYGRVKGNGNASYGGVVGSVLSVKNSRNEGAVELENAHNIGGVAGICGEAESCVNFGTVSGSNTAYTGGVVGSSSGGNIEKCANHGDVLTSESTFVGGVVGDLSGSVADCYNCGSVVGVICAGVVCKLYDSVVERCYNAGSVTSSSQCDAIVCDIGHVGSVVENCYYLDVSCAAGSGHGTALTDAQLRTGESYRGFDFEQVWTMEGSAAYPYAKLISIGYPALIGDVNGDGVVNANDALLVLRVSLGLETGLGLEADVNGDGVLNANDALLIIRAALGLA